MNNLTKNQIEQKNTKEILDMVLDVILSHIDRLSEKKSKSNYIIGYIDGLKGVHNAITESIEIMEGKK